MLVAVNKFLVFIRHEHCTVRQLRIQRNTYCEPERELSKKEYFRLVEAARKQGRQEAGIDIADYPAERAYVSRNCRLLRYPQSVADIRR